jgi:hypothetical protein
MMIHSYLEHSCGSSGLGGGTTSSLDRPQNDYTNRSDCYSLSRPSSEDGISDSHTVRSRPFHSSPGPKSDPNKSKTTKRERIRVLADPPLLTVTAGPYQHLQTQPCITRSTSQTQKGHFERRPPSVHFSAPPFPLQPPPEPYIPPQPSRWVVAPAVLEARSETPERTAGPDTRRRREPTRRRTRGARGTSGRSRKGGRNRSRGRRFRGRRRRGRSSGGLGG